MREAIDGKEQQMVGMKSYPSLKLAWRDYQCANCRHDDSDHYAKWYQISAKKPSACSECDCPEYVEDRT